MKFKLRANGDTFLINRIFPEVKLQSERNKMIEINRKLSVTQCKRGYSKFKGKSSLIPDSFKQLFINSVTKPHLKHTINVKLNS